MRSAALLRSVKGSDHCPISVDIKAELLPAKFKYVTSQSHRTAEVV